MSGEIIFFIAFVTFIVAVLLLDLLVIGKGSHVVSVKESVIWSSIWIFLALGFAVFLRFFGEIVHGIESFEDLRIIAQKYAPFLALDETSFENSLNLYRKNSAINFLSGYLIEKSLSVDNLFVMMAILTAFSVKKSDYKRVLFWGILGAIVMRCIFIFAGAALIYRFEWLLYIFGLYLIYVGIKMYMQRNTETKVEPQNHPVVKFLSKRFSVFPRYVGDSFFIKKNGIVYITPLLIVLIIIEFTDLVFALDSIPAIFSVTRDPYIVFFSNIFAILGLRALFFLLIEVVEKFYLLKIGVSILLVYVGLKLLFHEFLVHIGFKPVYSLYIILFVLIGSILLSIVFPKKPIHS
ncbi:MAG: TerC/Alx family metal homeostasis membrane protein [Bacteroidales bacterium]|nr:TerC/Alx family metal homeostasis membrane protein [Bacteroidales bacterium]MCF8456199.1 TerC/Alx family metal homeostasis membrane protein [Bacteroidales bacterium]